MTSITSIDVKSVLNTKADTAPYWPLAFKV